MRNCSQSRIGYTILSHRPSGSASGAASASTARDAASRAVLAEAAPLALPDGRWDKMVYPIRDCEQFLKAIC